jgi:N-acetylmuramoyl-L-alanine amidase
MAAALNATEGASLKKVGVHDSKNIAVIRGVLVPTVLVETCYMTSPEDAAMATTDAWVNAMAEGICLGIVNQLNK